ncbi:MAG TPA: hypothetical protein VKR52_16535 [Terracidiphilus sp.]|nr:hypothetical protein [Terracidiphilus sp.]
MNLQSKYRNRIFASCCTGLLLAALPLFSAQNTQQKQQALASQSQAAGAPDHEGSGEEKFQQYCSRCHRAPQSISPRIAGTVVRHMRVRASLSAQDERAILRYLSAQ